MKGTDEDGEAFVETGLAGRWRYQVVAPVEGISTRGSLLVASGRGCPYPGGHSNRHGSLPRGDVTKS